ncbi:MAG: serine hydrolase domain-containing protein [Gemmatimonadaceae bacterium]
MKSLLAGVVLFYSSGLAPLVGAQTVAAPSLDSVARELVTAINSIAAEAGESFIAQRLASSVSTGDRGAILALLDALHEESGGLEVLRIEAIGSGRFITARARAFPRLVLLNIAPDRHHPDKLAVVEVLKSWNPKTDSIGWPDKRLANDRAVVDVISRNVETLSAAGAFSGAVLVGRGDSIVFERGYGWANLEDSVRNTPDSRITIASIGKMFTATAIGQLIVAGKLSFDDTLARLLPEYPNPDRARRITIRQLLGHTAGLGNLFDDSAYTANRDYASPLELASVVAERPLLFPPGSKWSYSNEGYVVLGAVIEKVSGERYDDYLRRHIFTPAGMSRTGNFGPDDVVTHRAVGYRHHANDPLAVRSPYGNRSFVRKGSPAGGEYTTARDLWRFSRALLAGQILDPAVRDTLWVGRSPLPWDRTQRYGYGVIASSDGARTLLGHGGGGSGTGIDNEFRFSRDGSYAVVVLANIDPPAASDLAPALVKFLAAQAPPANRVTDRGVSH